MHQSSPHHGRRASELHATCHLASCASKCECPSITTPPSLALALPGALPPRARMPEHGRHGRRHQAPWLPPPLVYGASQEPQRPRLHLPCTSNPLATSLPRLCCSSSVRCHRRRWLPWPHRHKPPRAELGSPMGARRPPSPPHHSTAAVDDHGRRSHEPAAPLRCRPEVEDDGPRATIREKAKGYVKN